MLRDLGFPRTLTPNFVVEDEERLFSFKYSMRQTQILLASSDVTKLASEINQVTATVYFVESETFFIKFSDT